MSDTYVVNAIYRAEEGKQEELARALRAMTADAREEEGCLQYEIHRSSEDDRTFLIYEQYVGLEGFEAHKATPAFDEHIRNGAWPCLEHRAATFWYRLED
jgi:quinol monooxygenase YgiN